MGTGHVHLIYEHNCYIGGPSWWDWLRMDLGLATAVACRDFGSVWVAARPLGPEARFPEPDEGEHRSTRPRESTKRSESGKCV